MSQHADASLYLLEGLTMPYAAYRNSPYRQFLGVHPGHEDRDRVRYSVAEFAGADPRDISVVPVSDQEARRLRAPIETHAVRNGIRVR